MFEGQLLHPVSSGLDRVFSNPESEHASPVVCLAAKEEAACVATDHTVDTDRRNDTCLQWTQVGRMSTRDVNVDRSQAENAFSARVCDRAAEFDEFPLTG